MQQNNLHKQILIVDDSEDMRTLLGQILEEEEQYHLHFADSGAVALETAQQIHPDLILMDMSMPGVSGWETVKRLRQLPQFAHTPILAITAHVSQADQERARAIGCNGHVGKPFDVVTVLDTVEQILHASKI